MAHPRKKQAQTTRASSAEAVLGRPPYGSHHVPNSMLMFPTVLVTYLGFALGILGAAGSVGIQG